MRVVTLHGEAGIGKSRLLEELTEIAGQQGAAVLFGRCSEAGDAPALWPWSQILEDLLSGDGALAALAAVHTEGALAMLLPQSADSRVANDSTPYLEPERARFRLFDRRCGSSVQPRRAVPCC